MLLILDKNMSEYSFYLQIKKDFTCTKEKKEFSKEQSTKFENESKGDSSSKTVNKIKRVRGGFGCWQ